MCLALSDVEGDCHATVNDLAVLQQVRSKMRVMTITGLPLTP